MPMGGHELRHFPGLLPRATAAEEQVDGELRGQCFEELISYHWLSEVRREGERERGNDLEGVKNKEEEGRECPRCPYLP